MTEPEKLVPDQQEGVELNVEDSIELSSEDEAKKFFCEIKDRLFNVNKWKDLAGTLSANFQVTDSRGQEINRLPSRGDYFKIDIPAPGIVSGEGYDWVKVEEIKAETEKHDEYAAILVRPAPSPVNERQDIAHFYTDEATSSFIVRRNGKKIFAGVYGRNEKPNVEANTVVDKVRNAIVGTGAVSVFSKLQWKALVNGLLSPVN